MRNLCLLFIIAFSSNVFSECYRTCDDWDTFCKSPEQIIATKCRLGVPVKREYCEMLTVPKRYLIRGGGSLVEALPCTNEDAKGIIVEL